jgi:hypothetical protein
MSIRARAREYRASVSDATDLPANFETYLVLELTRTQYAIRSFAIGGCPYFEASGALRTKSDCLVEDIISGQMSPHVLRFFEGIDITGKAIMCFVCDARQSITLNYTVVLVPENAPGFDFRIKHTNSLSESVASDEFIAVKARPGCSSGKGRIKPAE